MLRLSPFAFVILLVAGAAATAIAERFPLESTDGLRANGVVLREAEFEGRRAVEITMEDDFEGGDSNTIALIEGTEALTAFCRQRRAENEV